MTTEDNSLTSLEQKLLKTTWVKEAEMVLDFVPHEDLTKTQIKILEKCVDKEELTDKQLIDLKKCLQKYRPAWIICGLPKMKRLPVNYLRKS